MGEKSMGNEVKRKWSEFVEEEKRNYVIEIPQVEVEEETVVFKELLLERKYFPIYPYGNYVSTLWRIKWDLKDTFEIEVKSVHDSWGGTGSEPIGSITLWIYTDETPWFFNYNELTEEIEKHGAKKTIERIIDYFAYLTKQIVTAFEEEKK